MKVPVEAFNTADFWRLSGTVKLRIYANQSFWTSDGQYVPQGHLGAVNASYFEVPCTVLSNVLTISGFEINSTVDALDNIYATYNAELVAGNRRIPFLNNFAINTIQPGDPSLRWPEIILLRNMLVPQSIPESLTRQIAAMITLAVGELNKSSILNPGVTALTATPIDVAFPIAVGANDPLWMALLAGTGLLISSGTAMLVDGFVTVPSGEVLADSKVFLSSMGPGVSGALRFENIVPGVGFDIISGNGGDNGMVSWMLAH